MPVQKKQRISVSLSAAAPPPAAILQPLSEFPVDLSAVDKTSAALLVNASKTALKADADVARRSTFPYLQAEDMAVVQQYSPVYAAGQLYYAQACLLEASSAEAKHLSLYERKGLVAECFRAVDLALLRTSVEQWKEITTPLLTRAQELAEEIEGPCEESSLNSVVPPAVTSEDLKPMQWIHDVALCADIPRVDARSLNVEQFLREYMEPTGPGTSHSAPVILQHGLEAWPALQRWANMSYLKKAAAARLVPVETYDSKDSTQTYLSDSWEQQVMSVGDFIDQYVLGGQSSDAGYLAQHPLFDQIPALRKDISVPPYCAAQTTQDTNAPESVECHFDPLISAWLGPKGTVSPLHNDPYHNLLCQVVGTKYIRLYSHQHTGRLYAREGPVCNNSYVDIDNVDSEAHPLFLDTPCFQCVLGPGEMLYIPRHFWHYVRSLSASFSVSFWY